ncbi:MAG: PadR family transcriptional regulator [Candidatus Hermodarchaeota archaeon]|jgi:PadR family transcriptional regulator PadR|nr:PadR family transcriptional regulator [Candidatus Hermodarchaeota archaeon]
MATTGIPCCPPGCCDMRGLLSFQLLWLLSKTPKNGQQLARELEQRRGSKPTPGTLYPALKELVAKQLIVGTRLGRVVVYQLTPKGHRGLVEACQYFYQVFSEIFEDCQRGFCATC